MNLLTRWKKSQKAIEETVGAATYTTWFSSIQVKEKSPNTLLIETPDEFFKNWFSSNYTDAINKHLNSPSLEHINIEFAINSHILKEDTQARLSKFEQGFQEVDSLKSANLNSRFTFENFVIGPSNRFACAASLAVAESPAKAYNPLFIYGHVGLGKTHLIQAITQKISQLHPKLKYCYISSERFTNELIDAIRHRSTTEFRKKYRNMDILVIDDIQFIAGKESTQEEFFHTFNNLHNNCKQIIITSDRPPKEIANLEERLTSRFSWGLITDIQPPNFETRVAILKKKIEREPIDVPNDVVFFIAEEIKTNIRELEGALIRVAAYSLLEEKTITLPLAKMILKDMVKESMKIISIEMIQKLVADFYKVSLSDLKAKKRYKSIVFPRQIAMYLSRELTKLSLPEIGKAFGGKDHTTVLHSCKKIAGQLKVEPEIRNTIEQLSLTLNQ